MLTPLRFTVATLALTVGVLGAFASLLSNSDDKISRAFLAAVETNGGTAPRAAGNSAVDWSHLHLSVQPSVQSVSAAVALGDRITIAGQDGQLQAYDVVDIRPLGDQPLLLVTARGTGIASSGTMRFVVDAMRPMHPAVSPAKPHAL